MTFVASNEVAELRTNFDGLHSDLNLLKSAYDLHANLDAYTAAGPPNCDQFAVIETKISDLLMRVKEKEVTMMDATVLRELAAAQTREHEEFLSVFESKTSELRALRIQLEGGNKKGLGDGQFKFIGNRTPAASIYEFAPTPVATHKKRKADPAPTTPVNKRRQPTRVASAQKMKMDQDSMNTGDRIDRILDSCSNSSPPGSPLSDAPTTVHTPSPLKKVPPMKLWSTQSPTKPTTEPLIHAEPEQFTEPEPKTPTRTRSLRKRKPEPKVRANTTQPKSQAKAKQPPTPSRQNPKRVTKSISHHIANWNSETVRLPEGVERNTHSLLEKSNSTVEKPVSSAQDIWKKRYPHVMSQVPAPDLPMDMSANSLNNELAAFTSRAFKTITDKHPDVGDEVNRILEIVNYGLERNKMLAVPKTAAPKDHCTPRVREKMKQLTKEVEVAKEAAATHKKSVGSKNLILSIKEKKIAKIEAQIAALKQTLRAHEDDITSFEGEERYYASILEENDQLKADVHALEADVHRYRNMAKGIPTEGKILDMQRALDASLDQTAKLQKQIRMLEQGTGKSIEETLATMHGALEKDMTAKHHDGYDLGEEYDEDLYYREDLQYNSSSRKRKYAASF
jgi:hypothetical protein